MNCFRSEFRGSRIRVRNDRSNYSRMEISISSPSALFTALHDATDFGYDRGLKTSVLAALESRVTCSALAADRVEKDKAEMKRAGRSAFIVGIRDDASGRSPRLQSVDTERSNLSRRRKCRSKWQSRHRTENQFRTSRGLCGEKLAAND